MKKLFQIAAFAIVGFIAFTSATSMRGFDFFVKNSTVPPATIDECVVHLRDQQQTPTAEIKWALYNATLSKFVQEQDITPLTIQQYIDLNRAVLTCPQVRLEVE